MTSWSSFLDIVLLLLLVWIVEDCFLGLGVDPSVKGIKKVPSYPILGNLLQIRNNPARVYLRWSELYQVPVFQVRIGYRNIIVANSYKSVEFLWGKCANANNSRPTLYVFHDLVSQTKGFTIGSTPASESLFRTKQVLSQELNHKSVLKMSDLIDQQVKYTIQQLIKTNVELSCPPSVFVGQIRSPASDIDMLPYFQLYALRSAIYLTFGIILDCYGKQASLSQEILEVENQIIRSRGQGSWLPDFLPFMKYFGTWKFAAAQNHYSRDRYMNWLFERFGKSFAADCSEAKNSILGRVISNNSNLSQGELTSMCLTLVSAGLDNTPFSLNHLMGHLSRPDYGYEIQKSAFSQLEQCYGDAKSAWEMCGYDMECSYIVALIQEALRFFTVLPLSLPRKTSRDINFNSITIPAGTILYMNAYAANHDSEKFLNPMKFDPTRWFLPGTMKLKSRKEIDHFAFGAGSRKCSGNLLAMQEMYTMVCRLVLIFRIRKPLTDAMELDPFSSNSCPSATSFEPKRFKVHLVPRYYEGSDEIYRLLL